MESSHLALGEAFALDPHRPANARPLSSAAALTEVKLICIEGRIAHSIRFGRVAAERMTSRGTCIQAFRPGAIFALVGRSLTDFGTVHAFIQILAAPAPGEAASTLPYVRPGADILLRIEGYQKVAQVLAQIDAVEAAGIDPCDASPDHWRHIANCLASKLPVRPYTIGRHAAWLRRRATEQ